MDIKNQPDTLLIVAVVTTVAVMAMADILSWNLYGAVLVIAISVMVTRLVFQYRDLSV